ncbi:NADP oxidoreductase [Pedobacter sp. Leaf216]|uniref:NADPH-dependent F420 reductase n=1 Tax=Pedobacter sp. Leaf216 TaxID=1735684 RepID=UPI0006FE6FF0|nr:NAD(P)-binding domain-containing protein [Pedobacter sp. Leaf216]KQM73063.1 NADP oxidoreductase [Pedobacter sp. Leaf216]
MKIGIIGTGYIGKTLALKLAKAGHEVTVANSRSPENMDKEVLATGAVAVTAQQAAQDKDVIILSTPLDQITKVAPLFAEVQQSVTVIDTSNYIPARDSRIERLEAGQVESLWVQEQLGRPIAKAWNAVLAYSLAANGRPAGEPGRIAIPIAADREIDREITKRLVEDTGFDAFYTGSLENSWRQQPGAPAYCTDLTIEELSKVIDTAEKERLPKRRDFSVQIITERMNGISNKNADWDFILRINRTLYM